MCHDLEVPYVVKKTQIGDIVFNQRKEKNPCALCARMRKGCLADTCVELGINKLALGHHRDDALETLLLSMFYEGRMHTFHPVTHLECTGITQIRPMVYLSEKQAISAARRLNLPVVESPCPVNHATRREDMKNILDEICRKIPKAREQMLSALMNHEKYELWSHEKTAQGDED